MNGSQLLIPSLRSATDKSLAAVSIAKEDFRAGVGGTYVRCPQGSCFEGGISHPRQKLNVPCKGSWWLIGYAICSTCWGLPMVALLGATCLTSGLGEARR